MKGKVKPKNTNFNNGRKSTNKKSKNNIREKSGSKNRNKESDFMKNFLMTNLSNK